MKKGLSFLQQQQERINLLQIMLRDFNDKHSTSPYCVACTLLPIEDLSKIINEMESEIQDNKDSLSDKKVFAKKIKNRLNETTITKGINLKLRRVKK